ncbi:MAG TPA: phosphoribosyltransferase family protein [Polyangiaceae bacterium]|nr:phosphoribosyltransferase family protein [Polyangiaceae bacterium]
MRFRDRRAAGKLLARELAHYEGRSAVVLAVPRGGVPVGAEVAAALGAPFDVVVVRKLGVPRPSQGGLVGVAEGGRLLVVEGAAGGFGDRGQGVAALGARESSALERHAHRLRDGGRPLDVAGRTVIVVDDGVATGVTAWAAIKALRERGPSHVVLASPVVPAPLTRLMGGLADEVVCLLSPEALWAIGSFYGDFRPVRDDDVSACLRRARRDQGATREGAVAPASQPWAGLERWLAWR